MCISKRELLYFLRRDVKLKQQYSALTYKTGFCPTALYMRLSRDDELLGESGSIQTQRIILQQYAIEHELYVVDEYIDDGWSGTNYDRPSFQRMIGDIENGKIKCVVVKDLSRLGRNYILTGQYIEVYFPSKGVRFIAINDNIDSNNGESELAPFLNILNEMHARQTSKKVKSAKHALFENGAHHSANAPIGYIKDPEQKGHILIDNETKWIVEKIFALALRGEGCKRIADILRKERIPTPSWISYQRDGLFTNIYENAPDDKKYAWVYKTIRCILRDETYIGNSIHYRDTSISFKNKQKRHNPQEKWFRVEHTHEAIVSEEDFQQVQTLITSRRRQNKDGTKQIFAGLLKCADCGHAMNYKTRKQRNTVYIYYDCGEYDSGIGSCSSHYIRYDVLYSYVLSCIQHWSSQAQKHEKLLLQQLIKTGDNEDSLLRRQHSSELRRLEKRKSEVDGLFLKIYEDWSTGRITEYNFKMLSQKYQDEQHELDENLRIIRAEVCSDAQDVTDAEKWISLIKQYTNPTELTAEMLNALIEKIVIHEAVKQQDGGKEQEIEIFYRFIGRV